MKPADTVQTLRPLTSLRFLAALAVFCSHLRFFQNYDQLRWIYDRVFFEGYLGVTFFFVLSGFILTYNYHSKIASLNWREVRKFYVARFARVYPVHLLTLLCCLPLLRKAILLNPGDAAMIFVPNVLLLQSYVPVKRVYYSYNEPSWSLCNEFFFYAVLPLILFFITRWNLRRIASLAFLAVGIWLFTLATVAWQKDLPLNAWLFYISPPFRLLDFTLGVLAGLVYIRCRNVAIPARVWTSLEFLILAVLAMQIWFAPYVHQSFRYGVYYMPVFGLAVFVFAFQRGILSGILSKDWFLLLGEMSFSFYMFHMIVFNYLYAISRGQLGMKKWPLGTALLALAITTLLSYLCFQFYEKNMRDKIRHWFSPEIQTGRASESSG